MKLYSTKPQASITMGLPPAMRDLLMRTVYSFGPGIAIESGTHVGLGSTTLLAELMAALPGRRVRPVYTLEVNFKFWQEAARNLRRFPQVRCLWGLSVKSAEAKAFLSEDAILQNHALEPDIYIDEVADPKAFYLAEVEGKLTDPESVPGPFVRKRYYREGLLPRLLRRHRDRRPLVLLDSAGGLGFLEFRTVREHLKGAPHLLVLDDIDHLKHYRSRRALHEDPAYTVLGESVDDGWLIAEHQGQLG